MICDAPEQAAGEIAHAIGASRASLTTNLRPLNHGGLRAPTDKAGPTHDPLPRLYALPARTVSAHWGIPDPSKVEGTDDQRRAAFTDALIQLTRRIELFVALGPEKLERMVLRDQLKRIHEGLTITPSGTSS